MMDIKTISEKLVPNPQTKVSKEDYNTLADMANKLPPITDKKKIRKRGSELRREGFKTFDNGRTIIKDKFYEFDMLVPVNHFPFILKLFKQFGVPGVQAYVEFVKKIYEEKLKLIEGFTTTGEEDDTLKIESNAN